MIARCAPTIAMPEHNKTTVFTRGNMKGFSDSIFLIPTGGQIAPIAIVGLRAP